MVEADDVPGGRLVFLVVTAEIGVGVRLDEELAAGMPEVDAVVAGDAQVMQEVYCDGEVLGAGVGHVKLRARLLKEKQLSGRVSA